MLDYFLNHPAEVTSIAISVVGFIISFVKLIKNKQWDKLKEEIKNLVVEAEGKYTDGKDKKQYVLDCAKTICKTLKIKYNEKAISAIIESLITITNHVNTKKG